MRNAVLEGEALPSFHFAIPYVGPIEVRFGNRRCFVGGMVMGDEVLLGAIPMEDLDLVVAPLTREVLVNPLSPNVPSASAKGSFPSAR